eukprot:m51a1_g7812 hypothetical protein (515) ;mRNA; r:96447-97991
MAGVPGTRGSASEPPAASQRAAGPRAADVWPLLSCDLAARVASLLDQRSRAALSRTCRAARLACAHPSCWRRSAVAARSLPAFCASPAAPHVRDLRVVAVSAGPRMPRGGLADLAAAAPMLEELRLPAWCCWGAAEVLAAFPRLRAVANARVRGEADAEALAARLRSLRGLVVAPATAMDLVVRRAPRGAGRGLREVGELHARALRTLWESAGGLCELEVLRLAGNEGWGTAAWVCETLRRGGLPRLRELYNAPDDVVLAALASPAPLEVASRSADPGDVVLPRGALDALRERRGPSELRALRLCDTGAALQLLAALPRLARVAVDWTPDAATARALAALPGLGELSVAGPWPPSASACAALSRSPARLVGLRTTEDAAPQWLALPIAVGSLRSVAVAPGAGPRREYEVLGALAAGSAATLESLEMTFGPRPADDYVPLLLRLAALRTLVAYGLGTPVRTRAEFVRFARRLERCELVPGEWEQRDPQRLWMPWDLLGAHWPSPETAHSHGSCHQ